MNKNKKASSPNKKEKKLKETGEVRHPEWETPSQRRNRDGEGRGQSGSDGGSVQGRGSNH